MRQHYAFAFGSSMAGTEIHMAKVSGGGSAIAGLLVTLLTLVLVQVGFGGGNIVHILNGALVDPDAYLRLDRVRLLWESGSWFDSTDPRISPPHGLVLHWTRPMDMVLLAGALPLAPFLGFREALHLWGVLVGPALQVAFLLALMWAAAPVLERSWRWLIALFSIAQPAILGTFVLGRPDHHGLLMLWLAVWIGLTIRLLMEPEKRNWAVWAGIAGAAGLWISVETLPATALGIFSMGLFWLLGERRLAAALVTQGASLLAGVAAALLIERGGSAFSGNEFDQISVAHLVLFGLNFAFWAGVTRVGGRHGTDSSWVRRAAWSVPGAALAGAVLWWAEPGFFRSPLADAGEMYMALVTGLVVESEPLFILGGDAGWTWATVARPLHWLGIGLPALPWIGYGLHSGSATERRLWTFLGLGAVAFLSLAVAEVRWSSYAEVFLLISYTSLAAVILSRIGSRFRRPALTIVRPLAVIGLAVWFLLPTAAIKSADSGATETAGAGCPLKPLSKILSDPNGWGDRPRRILALMDFGPELLYRTPHSVFTVPNHRPHPGFTTVYRIMTARRADDAKSLLRANDVDLLVTCPKSAERVLYETGYETFFQALARGEVPDFLTPVPLPEPLGRSFKVFSVRP